MLRPDDTDDTSDADGVMIPMCKPCFAKKKQLSMSMKCHKHRQVESTVRKRHRCGLEEETIHIDQNKIYNQVCKICHNIYAISYYFTALCDLS